MKISKLEKHKDKITFSIEEVSPGFINSLRRTIATEVPTLAIEDVIVQKNTGAVHNEMLVHRLGLIPIKTDLKTYNFKDECKCKGEGCARCEVRFQLKALGPCTVYAKDLKSSDPKVVPVYDDTVIAKLEHDQEIDLEAVAILGKGKMHTKWAPGIAYYKEYPKITVKDSKAKGWEKAAEACPVNVFYKTGKESLQVNKDNSQKCHLCMACVDACPSAVEVEGEENKFIFSVESWGQLSPEEIVESAVDILESQVKEFDKNIKV